MGQTRLLQKFRRFISLNAVIEHAEAYIAFLQQNTTSSDELAKFKKDLEEFKEEKIGAEDDMDYIQFLRQQPKFKAFIQRPTIDHYARKLFDILKSKISDSQLSQFQNEYKEFLEQSHEELDEDFLEFCGNKYYSLVDSMKGGLYEKQSEFARFKQQCKYDINHLEYLLIDLKEGHCFGFSITDALIKDWAEWEKKIKNWSGKYSDVQPKKSCESKINNDYTPEDLRGILSLAIQYVIPNHANRQSRAQRRYMPGTILQRKLLKPQAHEIALPESQQLSLPEEKILRSYLEISVFNKESKKYEIQSIQQYKLIAGDFSNTLSEVLDEKVIAGNICIIGPIDHTCRLSYENGLWTFYDPNEDERVTGNVDKIANIITEKFGTSIDIKVASFNSKPDLVFSKYDKLLEDSPHLLLGKQGFHVMAKHSPDTLRKLFERARADADLCSSIATALTATVLDHKEKKSGFEMILSHSIRYQDDTLLQELLKLASTNADISNEVAKALVQLADKTKDFLDFTHIIVKHIDQLKACFQRYPIVISTLYNFADTNEKRFQSGHHCAILKAVCIVEYIKFLCEKLSKDPESTTFSLKFEKNIENIKKYLPQYPSLIIELIHLAKSIKKHLPAKSKILIETIANIIESKEMIRNLPSQFTSNPSFIDNLFNLATSKENIRIKEAIQVALSEKEYMSIALVKFCERQDFSFFYLLDLAKDNVKFANTLREALLEGKPKNGLRLIIEKSHDGLARLIRFAQKQKNPELTAALASTLLTVKERTQTVPLFDFIQYQINGPGRGLSELFELAESKEGGDIRNALSFALVTADSSGKNGMDYLLSNVSEQFGSILRFIVSQNNPALNHTFYQSICKLQDSDVSFLRTLYATLDGDEGLNQFIQFSKIDNHIRFALMAALEKEPDFLIKLDKQNSELQTILDNSKKSYALFKLSNKGQVHLKQNQFKAALDCFEEVLKTSNSDGKSINKDEINVAQWNILMTVQVARSHAFYVDVEQCNLAINLHRAAVDLFKNRDDLIAQAKDFLMNDHGNLVAAAESYYQRGYFNLANVCFSEALYQLSVLAQKGMDVSQLRNYIDSRLALIKMESDKRASTQPTVSSGASIFSSSSPPASTEPLPTDAPTLKLGKTSGSDT